MTVETEINKIRSEEKILVNKHRDLEHMLPYSGTNLKALDRKEFAALKANLRHTVETRNSQALSGWTPRVSAQTRL